MSNDHNNPTPQSSTDLGSATVLTAFDIAVLSYDTYDNSASKLTTVISSQTTVDPVEDALISAGWTPIVDVKGQTVSEDSYQGVAFYKVINGTVEVIIGNRGSQSAHDFLVSDAQLAAGATPNVDGDALTYYTNVINWLQSHVNATSINVIETGHSLGGQEAGYVDVVATPNPRECTRGETGPRYQ